MAKRGEMIMADFIEPIPQQENLQKDRQRNLIETEFPPAHLNWSLLS